MTGLKLLLTRMNGWALSLLLHGGVAVIAGLSVFSVQLSGGNGNGSGGSIGSGTMAETYGATVRNADEPTVSGTVLPDVAQYGRLNSEETPLEPVAEELPIPTVPFDVFAVGSSEPTAAPAAPSLADPLLSRPGSGEGRTSKLPAASGDGQQDSESATGANGGSGDGDSDGLGHGEGTEVGNATGVYTPAPAYPSEARRRNIEGSVLVELVIASDGSCAVGRVVESSGFTPLDDAVQKTVSYWKYKPASADGRPDTTTRRMRFTFRLGR
jgi:protein TonB